MAHAKSNTLYPLLIIILIHISININPRSRLYINFCIVIYTRPEYKKSIVMSTYFLYYPTFKFLQRTAGALFQPSNFNWKCGCIWFQIIYIHLMQIIFSSYIFSLQYIPDNYISFHRIYSVIPSYYCN